MPDHPQSLLCACSDCVRALGAATDADPRLTLAVVTDHDRLRITAEYVLETLATGATLSSLLFVPGDVVRGVAVDDRPLPFGRWWSAALSAEGRKRSPYRTSAVRSRRPAA